MKVEITIQGIDALFSFFAESEQIDCQLPHKIIAQFNDDACVAACVRMILADFDIDAPESYLAAALETSKGALLSKVPQVLKEFGLRQTYKWRENLSFADLTDALKKGSAIVSVKRQGAIFGHALVIDAIFKNEILVRDPLPKGQGKSYAVAFELFSEVFLRGNETGTGVIYVE